jgi:hypothetical protein
LTDASASGPLQGALNSIFYSMSFLTSWKKAITNLLVFGIQIAEGAARSSDKINSSPQ